MFKLAACFWMALMMPVAAYGEDNPAQESQTMLGGPAQYFAVEAQDERYWTLLFPDDPSFAYACLYLPSFDREFGFYLDGDTLHWARAAGPCSAQMLSQFPIVRLQGMAAQVPGLLAYLPFPVLGNLLEGWDRIAGGREEDPFSSGESNLFSSLPQFREGCMLAADWAESTINPILYSRLFVRRGAIALKPALADTLRKTWDEAVTSKTFSMDLYRQCLTGCDGDYFYFRGMSGPVGEDLCRGAGMMRPAMRDLAYALIDMVMMNDLKPEAEQWLMDQCARIRKHAAGLGDNPPPMVSDAWVHDFLKRLAEQEKRDAARREEQEKKEAAPEVSAGVEEKENAEEKASSSSLGEDYVRGFRQRFLRSLDRNPLWKDLFPAGTQGKPGVCWLGSRGISGFYLDGSLMGRAESMAHSPLYVYDRWFFDREPERALFPYEGFPDGDRYMEPRVKREWLDVGETVSRRMAEMLTGIAKGEMASREGKKEEKQEDIHFCVVRGADGTERVMSSSDADVQAVIDLMEALYTVDLLFCDYDDYLQEVVKKRDVLQKGEDGEKCPGAPPEKR